MTPTSDGQPVQPVTSGHLVMMSTKRQLVCVFNINHNSRKKLIHFLGRINSWDLINSHEFWRNDRLQYLLVEYEFP